MDSTLETSKQQIKPKRGSLELFLRNTPEKIQTIFLHFGLLFSDLLMIGFAFRFAYWIRFETNLPFFAQDALASPDYYENLIIFILPVWLLVFFLSGLYKIENLMGGVKEYNLLFSANTVAVLSVVAAGFFQPNIIFARGWLLISWISAFFYTTFGRFFLRRIIYYLRTKNWFLIDTVVVGYNEEAVSMVEQFLHARNSGLRISGFLDCGEPPGTILFKQLKCLGSISDLRRDCY